MRRLASGVVAGILIAEFAAAGLLGWLYSSGRVLIFDKPVDLAAIVLTATAVIVTVATVIIALVALWGMRELGDRAVSAARQEVREFQALVFRNAQDYLRYDEESGVGDDAETDRLAGELMQKLDQEDRNNG